MKRTFRILTVVFACIFAQGADAQFFDDVFPNQGPPRRLMPQRAAPPLPKPAEPPPAPNLPDPPYQSRLDRLSEILGALYQLRPLCFPAEKSAWREQMLLLLDGENPTQNRRDRMIGAFNRSYLSFKENYHRCNASAKLAGKLYLEEAKKLSRDLTSRFTD
jgi:uncharacterized protein (TIGR02301 family)